MRVTRYARGATAAVVSVLAVACSDEPLSPRAVVGTYALQQIAGVPLPATAYTSEDYTLRVYADTLRLGADGRGHLKRVGAVFNAGHPTAALLDVAFSAVTVGDRLDIYFDCPPNASCIAGPHLFIRQRGQGLHADYPTGGGWNAPLVYARVAP